MKSMKNWLTELLPEGTPSGQERAVTGDDALITVSAGAGTGKTWVLSTRFARLLFSDRECLPEDILTLTFTEAAAREMQERIKKRVLELIALQSPEEQQAWQPVKDGFDEAWISTIHAFAARLIKESGLSLDIDPQSGVVSAPQEEEFWGSLERSLESLDLSPFAALYGNKTLSRTAERLEKDDILLAALEKWSPSLLRDLARGVTELHASLGHTYETLLTWADEAEREGEDAQVETMSAAVLDLLRPRWEEAWQLWSALFTEFQSEIRQACETALKKSGDAKRINPAISLGALMERWIKLQHQSLDIDIQRLFYLDLCVNLNGGTSKLFRSINDFLGQSVSKWRDTQKKWSSLSERAPGTSLSESEQRLRATLLRLSAFAWGVWDEMKRRRGLLSFSDMIHYAAQSIRTDERRKGFKHVLVDEFQDTDPLQNSMILALRNKENAKLFIVGDPKQAIYRFRHADLTLFADTLLRSRLEGDAVSLDVSFRTRDALLQPINALFARIWKEGLGAGERMGRLKFEPLSAPGSSPFPDREFATVPPYGLLLSVKKGLQDNQSRERLAQALVNTFARYVEEGRTVWDKRERRLRPVCWRDFAILTPTRSEYGILETAFERAGIPAVFEKSMSYFSRGEVGDVINTLRAVAFPRDETALAGWMASPFSGISLEEAVMCLKTHAGAVRNAPGTSLYSVLEERLPETTSRLRYLRHLGSLKGPSSVLSTLLEDRTWLASFEVAQRLRIVSNIDRAIAVARQYENGISASLAGCAQWLDTALRTGKTIEEPEWMDEETDAVHVTTIHAAKGLEFPVVAVMRMERGVGGEPPATVSPSKKMGVALSDIPDMMKSNSENSEQQAEREEIKPYSLRWERALSAQSELEESTRLFYVAATRAQDALLLCGIVSENKDGEQNVKDDSWLSWTLSWLAEEHQCGWQDLQGPPITFVEEITNVTKIAEAAPQLSPTPCRPLALPVRDETLLSSFSATSFALFEWCPFAWRRRHRQGLDLRWETPDDGDTPGGSDMGSLAHWILARWDMATDTLTQWLDDDNVALRLPTTLRDTWRDAKNKQALRSWLSAFSLSDEGRIIANAACTKTLRRESAFCAAIGDLRLVGATDVLWQGNEDVTQDGYWHVRDYKITLSDNAPAELYRAQLAFYALVVKLLTEKQSLSFKGVDVGLVFLREGGRLGDTRQFPLGCDWPTMQSQVYEAARTAAQGPWVPKREHCRFCPWRTGCSKRG